MQIKNTKEEMKHKFSVAWSMYGIRFSDRSMIKTFLNHNDALDFIEDESKKVAFVKATKKAEDDYARMYNSCPVIAQIECLRKEEGCLKMYGASERFILPKEYSDSLPFVQS